MEKEKARLEKEEKRKSQDTKPSRFSGILGRGAGGAVAGGAAVGAGAAGAAETATDGARPATSKADGTEPTRAEDDEEESDDDVNDDDENDEEARPTTGTSKYSADDSDEDKAKDERVPDTTPIMDGAAEPEPVSEPVAVPAAVSPDETPTSPISPKGDSKVRSWFKSRFRTPSKTQNDLGEKPAEIGDGKPIPAGDPAAAEDETPAHFAATVKSDEEQEMPRSDSMRDVAMAGRISNVETDDMYGDGPAEPVSPVKENATGPEPAVRDRSASISSLSEEDKVPTETATDQPISDTVVSAPEAQPKMSTDQPASDAAESESEQRGRKGFRQRLLSKVKREKQDKQKEKAGGSATQPAVAPVHEATTVDGQGGGDDDEEARDTFEEQKLAPPPKLSAVTSSGSPRGSRERSKFTEDL